MRVLAFIDSQKTEFDLKTLCSVCEVSRSSYYEWAARRGAGPDEKCWDEAIFANKVFDVWERSRGRYGVPRVTRKLRREGTRANRKRVARVMGELGLRGRAGRRKFRTTIADPNAQPAPDLVGRNFVRDQPDQLWLGDLTYVPTDQGFLYVTGVLDAATRRLLGWSITDHMRADAFCDALRAAAATRGRVLFDGLIFHSDHGSQYTSDQYRLLCKDLHITQSMGTVGDSYDNAMAESFWASLKREVVDFEHYRTRQEARTAVFEWLVWYNRERLHSSIDYLPPEEYDQLLLAEEAA